MALLSLEAIRDRIARSPSVYPQNLDLARQAVLLLEFRAEAYRAASFLDDRVLTPQSLGRWTPISEVAEMIGVRAEARPVHFVFHAGHVGSTLVSRLLDGAGGVLGLREPLPLRVLAGAHGDLGAPYALLDAARWRALLSLFLALWARGYEDTRAVVVKATSSASVCAAPLLELAPAARAIVLNLAPEPYLATLLAGENSPLDLRGQAQDRMKRLWRLAPDLSPPLHALSLGEIAAMSWTAETLTHRDMEQRFRDRVLCVDFDDFLAAPGERLAGIAAHFALEAPQSFFDNVARDPVMTRYSKAPEHAFTPETRRQILAQSRARNGEEIRKGLAWLDAFARAHPALGAQLSA